jgi:hypothetical protein
VKQWAQKDQGIETPGPQYSQKREENYAHKGNGATQNHPKRMISPYIFLFLLHKKTPSFLPENHGLISCSTILRAKGVPKVKREGESGYRIRF